MAHAPVKTLLTSSSSAGGAPFALAATGSSASDEPTMNARHNLARRFWVSRLIATRQLFVRPSTEANKNPRGVRHRRLTPRRAKVRNCAPRPQVAGFVNEEATEGDQTGPVSGFHR